MKSNFTTTSPAYRSANIDDRNDSVWYENGTVDGVEVTRRWAFDFEGATELADDDLPWNDESYVTHYYTTAETVKMNPATGSVGTEYDWSEAWDSANLIEVTLDDTCTWVEA